MRVPRTVEAVVVNYRQDALLRHVCANGETICVERRGEAPENRVYLQKKVDIAFPWSRGKSWAEKRSCAASKKRPNVIYFSSLSYPETHTARFPPLKNLMEHTKLLRVRFWARGWGKQFFSGERAFDVTDIR